LHLVIGDPNKEALDPDKLAKGVVAYVRNNPTKTAVHPIYDFFVRYVQKLHSDKYIKSTLKSNRGQRFLELIGPSDVAYVITLLKNSIEVWKHEPPKVAETDGETVEEVEATAPVTSVPKPLFTRGAHVKRTFGKTAWSDEGMEYYKATLETWKKMFARRSTFFNVLSSSWDDWLESSTSVLNPNGWARKDLQSLLRTIPEGSGWKDEERGEEKAAKVTEISYESEDEGGPLIGFGQVMEGTSREHSEDAESEEFTTNNDDMDDCNNMGLGKAQKSSTHQEDSGNDDDLEGGDEIEEEEAGDKDDSDEEHTVIDNTKKRRSQKDKSPPSKQPPSVTTRGAKRAKK
jgi:hypothetical protein